VSTTPSTAASPEERARYSRQIEQAFEGASKIAGSNLPPAEFYEKFLNTTLQAIDAPAGAVWLRTPQGFLQIACQVNLDKVGLENRRGGRQCHNEILRQVFQAAPPRPVMLEPNGRLAPNQGVEQGAVPAANLTDYFALFAPIVTPEKQAFGILEVFQDTKHDPRLYPTFLNYSFQMAGYASQYHQFTNARQASGMERTFTQVETFARLIHTTLNPTEVAYHVANEGRKLIECDRLCVGVRYATKKVTVEAVSGADVVEKSSTHVRRLRKLMESVNLWGDTLTFKGTKDAGLPPAVSHALDEYLAESQPKLLIVQPIRDEREKDQHKPARSIVVLESFNPPEQTDPIVQRLEVVGKHAAPALYNAAQMKRVPLKFLWWPLAKLQEGVGGKGRAIGFGVAILLAVLIGVMVLVPAPLRMEAKGQLLPVEIGKIFAPREMVIRKIKVGPGDKLMPGDAAVEADSEQARNEYMELTAKLKKALGDERGAFEQQNAPGFASQSPTEQLRARSQLQQARLQVESLNKQIDTLKSQYNFVLDQGVFRGLEARAPEFDPKLKKPSGVSRWTVLNDDRRESLLGRTVQGKDELIRVGNLEGPWHAELKIPQRNVGQVLKAFATKGQYKTDAAGKKYLDVDVLLASQPDTSYLGRLYQEDLAAEAVPNKDEHNENEPVVVGYVKLNLPDLPKDKMIDPSHFVTGLEVRTRVRCGDHPLGYSLFHGVWEWFYEKVVFFFF
jgi:hypothetical protein